VQPLGCGGSARDALSAMVDDYAFVFSPKTGAGMTLQAATGESGIFEFSASSGMQSLEIHCLDAVQPKSTDDYWNWDFWAETTSTTLRIDGGSDR
jgi:hypothetical protein